MLERAEDTLEHSRGQVLCFPGGIGVPQAELVDPVGVAVEQLVEGAAFAAGTLGECEIPFVCVAGRVLEPIRWERALLAGFTEHVLERVEPWVFPAETPIIEAVMASSAVAPLRSPTSPDAPRATPVRTGRSSTGPSGP